MKIVIVHYHLRPGGVTGVIRQQVLALHEEFPQADLTVLVGEGSDDFRSLPCRVAVVPALDYYVPDSREEAFPVELEIFQALRSENSEHEVIFHFHNPTLGKNPCLTGAIHSLLDSRVPVISTCHDFSEDRPGNQQINEQYAAWSGCGVNEFLYPDRSNCHYITINSSDRHRKHWGDLNRSTCQVMSPPVQALAPAQHSRGEVACWLNIDVKKQWMFYPVRAIERKNIGEFLLLSLLDEGMCEWLLARAPANDVEKPLYRAWVDLAEKMNIPVRFDVGQRIQFGDLMNAADRIVTTSTREGFGMAFLEPWYAGKPVVGRELPMVVDDMRAAGVLQDLLYTELLVPQPGGEWIDFAALSSEQKLNYVEKAAENGALRETIRVKNRWWNRFLSTPSEEVFQQNYTVIDETFSKKAFGRRLKKLYLSLF